MAIFTYTKVTGQYYSHYTDEWFEDGFDFEYEPDSNDLMDAIAGLIYEDYFELKNEDKQEVKQKIRRFVIDHDLEDMFVEYYKDDLQEYFKEEAFDSLCD